MGRAERHQWAVKRHIQVSTLGCDNGVVPPAEIIVHPDAGVIQWLDGLGPGGWFIRSPRSLRSW